jgi:hypothetical protein
MTRGNDILGIFDKGAFLALFGSLGSFFIIISKNKIVKN